MTFAAKQVTRTRSLHLEGPAAHVFPLFEPLGEMRWAEGWEPTLIYPASGEAVEGMVFTTAHAGEPDAVWTMVRHDTPSARVEYLRVMPGVRVGRISVRCRDNPDGTAQADVTYTETALTEHGNQFIDRFTEDHYGHWMAQWELAINHFLRHGAPLKHH